MLNLVGIVGKVQKEFKINLEKRLDVGYVLRFLKESKFEGEHAPIFKRRYLMILTHWVKILPKPQFLDNFNFLVASLS